MYVSGKAKSRLVRQATVNMAAQYRSELKKVEEKSEAKLVK